MMWTYLYFIWSYFIGDNIQTFIHLFEKQIILISYLQLNAKFEAETKKLGQIQINYVTCYIK